VPTENVVIRNCKMSDGHGGVVIGSEMTGGAWNIFAENCTMNSPNLDRALRIKTNSVRGGTAENVYLRNITVGQVAEAVLRINFLYGEGDVGDFTPTVKNIFMERVTSGKSRYALFIQGYDRSPITAVHLSDCTFENVEKPNQLVGVKGLVLDNVMINGEQAESVK
jgi:polygalacturonase